jgi:putative membrane protein
MNTILASQVLFADWGHMDGGAWVWMGLGMIIFWGLVIFGVVWLVRALTDHRGPAWGRHTEPSALDLLDRKLAEGSISVEDYRERRELLKRSSDDG